MQPAYLAWPGFYHRMMLSDVCVILDYVLIDKNSKTKFANRNRIRTPQGWTWLSLPIQTKGKTRELFINEITVDQTQAWAKKHFRTIDNNYRKAGFYSKYKEQIQSLYEQAVAKNRLVEVINLFHEWVCETIDLDQSKILYSSEMHLEKSGSDLILEICQKCNASDYLSGPFGRDYLSLEDFSKANIEVFFHQFSTSKYLQCWPGFEENLSIIDMIMNLGGQQAKQLLEGSGNVLTKV